MPGLFALWRVPFLRRPQAQESDYRSGGYRLNALGRGIDRILTTLFPGSFCNILVYSGIKSFGL